jgi:uncharacterized protein YndB with AHSA1/START domain
MNASYMPGAADATLTNQEGDNWTFVLAREFRHPPEKVWQALTDPAQLREWAPYDADGNLGVAGSTVTLTTVGSPTPHSVPTTITRAEYPSVLVFNWGGHDVRWELEDYNGGTRLKLWASIDRRYISMGAAGWHICLDVLGHHLADEPLGRRVGMGMLNDAEWQRLNTEYAAKFNTRPRSEWSENK